jgi:hypothetical protein
MSRTNDNFMLMPGNLLSDSAAWQAMANRLPHRAVLIILPTANQLQKQTMLAVAKRLATSGRQVSAVPAGELSGRQRYKGRKPSIRGEPESL